MTKTVEMRFVVSFAWWWHWLYFPGVRALALCGMVPDWDKFTAMAMRAARLKLEPVGQAEVRL